MLVALLVSPVAAQTIDPINGFAIEPFNPACTLDGGPTSIIAGRDGNLWFTERFGNKIGRIAPTSGLITEFCQVLTAGNPSGITGSPRGITVGPDGNIWFAEVSGVIGRDRKSTRLNSSHTVISYAVFCLKKKKKQQQQ